MERGFDCDFINFFPFPFDLFSKGGALACNYNPAIYQNAGSLSLMPFI